MPVCATSFGGMPRANSQSMMAMSGAIPKSAIDYLIPLLSSVMMEKLLISMSVPDVDEIVMKWALRLSLGRPKNLRILSKVMAGYS